MRLLIDRCEKRTPRALFRYEQFYYYVLAAADQDSLGK